MKSIQETIVDTAKKYVGQEEVRGNMGFKNHEFDEKMRTIGFQDKFAWCALFTELVWREAYAQCNSLFDAELNDLFSAGAVKTYNNFNKSSNWEVSSTPEIGDVIIWQYYKDNKPHWTGHAGIVCDVDLLKYENTTIEGNTNPEGGREGYAVSEKVRAIDFSPKEKGLVIKGFIHPNNA